MRSRHPAPRHPVLIGALIASTLLAGAAAGAADSERERTRSWSREKESKEKDHGWSKQEQMDQRTAKRYAEAIELLQEQKFDESQAVLDKIRLKSLSPGERAKIYRTYAFVAYGRENLAGARNYLEKALAENGLEPDEQADVQFQIAQMYLAEENWAKVVENLKRWFEIAEKPNSSAYYLMAIAYYQMKDLDAAIGPARKAVELSEKPQEGWLQLLLALRLTRQEYAESVPLLEQLSRRFPKKIYYIQLSTVYATLGNYQEALIQLQLAYVQGLLTTDAEVRRLSEMLLYMDLPYRAAEVMAKGIDDGIIEPDARAYEILSNSRIAARDYDEAVAPLEHAAELSKSGDLFIRLAQVHLQREQWDAAAEALRHALAKGIENEGDAKLLMGIAQYSRKEPLEARKWFVRASEHASTRGEAEIWLKHIDRELQSG